MTIEATVTLTDAGTAVGRGRIRLLQAVAREGSIAAGAKAAGLTYKAAWDALEAMSNLFGRPLLYTRKGGAAGGGATLSPAGIQVLEAYGRIEAEMARVVSLVEPDLRDSGISPVNLFSGFFMKTSARNALRGTITHVASDTLHAEVAVTVSDTTTIYAMITKDSLRDLGLCVGCEAIVLIKATFVVIALGNTAPAVSTRNCVRGTILRCEKASVSAEVVLDIGSGKTLAATISAQSADALHLSPGTAACALFDAAHVIIAID
jgi:molybdate transport system regulatory protein